MESERNRVRFDEDVLSQEPEDDTRKEVSLTTTRARFKDFQQGIGEDHDIPAEPHEDASDTSQAAGASLPTQAAIVALSLQPRDVVSLRISDPNATRSVEVDLSGTALRSFLGEEQAKIMSCDIVPYRKSSKARVGHFQLVRYMGCPAMLKFSRGCSPNARNARRMLQREANLLSRLRHRR